MILECDVETIREILAYLGKDDGGATVYFAEGMRVAGINRPEVLELLLSHIARVPLWQRIELIPFAWERASNYPNDMLSICKCLLTFVPQQEVDSDLAFDLMSYSVTSRSVELFKMTFDAYASSLNEQDRLEIYQLVQKNEAMKTIVSSKFLPSVLLAVLRHEQAQCRFEARVIQVEEDARPVLDGLGVTGNVTQSLILHRPGKNHVESDSEEDD